MTRIIERLKDLRRARCGTAAVEFVLILPLLALMLYGTIDIGRLLFDYHAASKSVRDSTRYLARLDATALGLNPATCAINAGLPAALEARNLALTGSADGSSGFLLDYWTDPTSVTFPAQAPFDNTGGDFQGYFTGANAICSLTTQAQVTFPIMNGWLFGQGTSLTFTISHNEIHLGQ